MNLLASRIVGSVEFKMKLAPKVPEKHVLYDRLRGHIDVSIAVFVVQETDFAGQKTAFLVSADLVF